MTEEQPYDVVARYPGFELRRYPEHVVAEVEVRGSFESAGNAAFRPLAAYINGANDSSTGLAMTAPVVQRADDDAGRHAVSFVLPSTVPSDGAPTPTDPRVHVRTVPERYAAAASYSGRWTEESYLRKVADLLAAVTATGLEVAGPPAFARFDPPWKPWFARRNEVVVPVTEPPSAGTGT